MSHNLDPIKNNSYVSVDQENLLCSLAHSVVLDPCIFSYQAMFWFTHAPKLEAFIFPINVHKILASFSIVIPTTILCDFGLFVVDKGIVQKNSNHSHSRADAGQALPPLADPDTLPIDAPPLFLQGTWRVFFSAILMLLIIDSICGFSGPMSSFRPLLRSSISYPTSISFAESGDSSPAPLASLSTSSSSIMPSIHHFPMFPNYLSPHMSDPLKEWQLSFFFFCYMVLHGILGIHVIYCHIHVFFATLSLTNYGFSLIFFFVFQFYFFCLCICLFDLLCFALTYVSFKIMLCCLCET